MAEEKKRCVTKIPRDWPQLKTPAYYEGMTTEAAKAAWFSYLRVLTKVHPNPPVYKGKGDA